MQYRPYIQTQTAADRTIDLHCALWIETVSSYIIIIIIIIQSSSFLKHVVNVAN